MKTLKESKVGDTVRVVRLHGEGAVKRRQWQQRKDTRRSSAGLWTWG